jgi:nitroreductase
MEASEGDTTGWSEDLEEVVRIGKAQGIGDDAWAERKRKNVTADLSSLPNMHMWVAKQTMIAATTMMWMAEALGYDTGPMEGFDEEQVRAVLNIPAHVRVLFLLAIGRGRTAGIQDGFRQPEWCLRKHMAGHFPWNGWRQIDARDAPQNRTQK